MSSSQDWGGIIRKLWPTESEKFRDHLLRLDKTNRRQRFGYTTSDEFLIEYAERANITGSILYGYIEDGQVRASAELRRVFEHWNDGAEAAFSVEHAFQNRGLGSELLGRVVRAARNRGVTLMRSLMDEVTYNKAGNELVLRKRPRSCANDRKGS